MKSQNKQNQARKLKDSLRNTREQGFSSGKYWKNQHLQVYKGVGEFLLYKYKKRRGKKIDKPLGLISFGNDTQDTQPIYLPSIYFSQQ